MRVDVITIFPQLVTDALTVSIPGIAQERRALELHAHDLREWALPGVHRQVDDAPYGGGPGMVMRPEPFFEAVEAVKAADPREAFVVLLTPRGVPLTQEVVEDLSGRERLMLLCGRYEGIDERVRTLVDFEVSIGDYVLSGGEPAAIVVVDAVSRLLPGVLGDDRSAGDESFDPSSGLLEYPHYTRPASYRGLDVPEVLTSGDHAKIAAWRRRSAVIETARTRPDLLRDAGLSAAERALADESRPDTDQTRKHT